MRLASVTVSNFRCYKEPVTVRFDDFTALIGRNDVGKSTLIEALEIFFNNETVVIDAGDACVHGNDKVVEIICTFEDPPDTLTIDAAAPTTLAQEHLLDADGNLRIVKRFDCSRKPKEEVFADAHHPTHEHLRDLLQLKNAQLKARADQLQLDLTDVNRSSNVQLRAAIRAAVQGTDYGPVRIPLAEDDGKRIWEQVSRVLPAFALFQSDRPSRDDDPEVSDPMKIAVAAAIKEVEPELEAIKERVRISATDVANRTLAKLREMAPELASELKASFKSEPKWDGFKLSLTGDDQIPINKRGSGVRRLILLNFFRAEAERRRSAAAAPDVIYAIEEPESSQHPDNQMMLLRALLDLSSDPNTQVIVTTHVPAMAAMVPQTSVRLVTKQPDGTRTIGHDADDIYAKASEELGLLPDRRAQVGIYVEGPHDVSFLTHVSRTYRSRHGELVDLDTDHRIAFIPTGGGNLKHWVNRQYLRNAGLCEVHIYDRDDRSRPKYADQAEQVNNRPNNDIAFLTKRRELENYIHPDCVRDETGHAITITDWCDVPQILAEAIHIASGSPKSWAEVTEKKQGQKMDRAKRHLNNEIAARMTLDHLDHVDQDMEILGWLRAIAERVR
jgi:putative ATP-dependent endonuclease of OLD family